MNAATGRPPRRRGRYAGPRPSASPRGLPLAGQSLELEVGPVAHGGFCVARHEGQVVFVRHTLPGERVRAVVTDGGSEDRFLRADAVEVLQASADRVEPVCRHAGLGGCGGCDWQHASVEAQRRLKGEVVAEQLRRLAGLDLPVVVEPLPGDVDGFGWRTRVEFAVDAGGRAGLRRHRSHEVIPVAECPIADPRVLASGVLEGDWSGSRAVDVVAPSGGGSVVVVPVRVPVRVPGGADEVPVVRERVESPSWTGEFEVSARGFWQVHPGAAATFVDAILRGLDPRPGDWVLDLYAGAGLFAVPLADAVGPGGRVLAVEGDVVAVNAARVNCRGRDWVEVLAGRVEDVLAQLSGESSQDSAASPAGRAGGQVAADIAAEGSVDLVVLDPPRTGAGRAVIEAVAALAPRAIAYVACDPAALARDLAYARAAGYALGGLTAYDAFPMTHHVECVAVLRPVPAST